MTRFEAIPLRIALPQPVQTAIHAIESVHCVAVRIHSDQDLSGEGFAFCLQSSLLKPLQATIECFAEAMVGLDPTRIEALWQGWWRQLNPLGQSGLAISALSALDTACWDLIGKQANMPLYRLFGHHGEACTVYASGGLWLGQSLDSMLKQADDYLAQGFRAVKLRIGQAKIAEDLRRMAELRQALGADVGIYVDANQAYGEKQAIRMGQGLAPFEPVWLEEPVSAHDLEAHAAVRAAVALDIAAGETGFTLWDMQRMLQAKACDVLMPDLQRMGGLSAMRKCVALCEAYRVPLSTHFFTEYSLSIAGSSPQCVSVEHIPWFECLFEEPAVIEDGRIQMPQQAGTGFRFSDEALTHFRLDR